MLFQILWKYFSSLSFRHECPENFLELFRHDFCKNGIFGVCDTSVQKNGCDAEAENFSMRLQRITFSRGATCSSVLRRFLEEAHSFFETQGMPLFFDSSKFEVFEVKKIISKKKKFSVTFFFSNSKIFGNGEVFSARYFSVRKGSDNVFQIFSKMFFNFHFPLVREKNMMYISDRENILQK